MIHFNKGEHAKERGETKPLTLVEENQVIETINNLLRMSRHEISAEEKQLLQNFVNHYQNMCHYVSYTGGLFCTDMPDEVIDNKKILFQLKF